MDTEISACVIGPEARRQNLVSGAPRLSSASGELLREIQIIDEQDQHRAIQIPLERALTIRLDDREIVTLMTLGASPEWLVAGYLRNQQLVTDVTLLDSISVDWPSATATVRTRQLGARAGHAAPEVGGLVAAAGCSLGTGFADLMKSPAAITGVVAKLPSVAQARVSRGTLLYILEVMQQYDAIHRAAGSVHSCALFRGSEMWVSIEDVSRHNGVDSITGWMALHSVGGADKILFTTGRLTGELVMKAAFNGIPILASRNGVTASGYDVATRFGMTLFGRAAKRRYLCYTGAERFAAEDST